MKTAMKRTVSMTEGNIWKGILFFCIPMILGNLIQQLYNTVDAMIVGKYVGSTALAAIGACNPIVGLLIGSFTGISTGAGIIIAQFFGAEDWEALKRANHTSLALSVIIGLMLTMIGVLGVPVFLKILNTPADVYQEEYIYLKIYFAGIIFTAIYNMAAGILKAVGDSRSALFYLAAASAANIVLDFLFVVVLKLGIAGAAAATVISQFLSCLLSVGHLVLCREVYAVELTKIRLHRNLWKKILKVGIPVGAQNFVRSISNMILQAQINGFGTAAIAGYAAYIKIDDINWLPAMSLGMAASIFTGQNIGAGKYTRTGKGMKIASIIGIAYTTFTAVFLIGFDRELIGLFSHDAEVIHYGVLSIRMFIPFYSLYVLLQVITGAIGGAGKTFHAMLIYTFSICIFRVIWAFAIQMIIPAFSGMMSCYPMSWGVGTVLSLIYIKKSRWMEESGV